MIHFFFLCFLVLNFQLIKCELITLDQSNPKNVLWLDDLKNNDIYTVCALNGTLQLLISDRNPLDLPQFILFDGNDTNGNNLIGGLDSKNLTAPLLPISLAKSIKSKSGCFTIKAKRHILTFTDQSDVALFRIVEETTKNCQNENNVYQTPHSLSRIPASMTATKKGSCEMIILSATDKDKALPFIWLSNITTNSNLGKFTFKSTINNKILIEINGSEILTWQSFGIYTPALSIIIPESNKITMGLEKVSKNFSWNYTISGLPQNGLLMTPYDCGFAKTFTNYLLYNFNLDRATMIDFKYLEKTNNFPQINDVPLLNSTTNFLGSVGVTANRTSANMEGFLIQYTIHPQALLSTSTTTTTAKITSSYVTTPTTKKSTTPAPTTSKITTSHGTTPTTKKQSSIPSSTTTAPTTTAKITSSYVKTSTTKSSVPSTTTTPTTTIFTTSTTKKASTTTKHVASSSMAPPSTSIVSKTTTSPTTTTTNEKSTSTPAVATTKPITTTAAKTTATSTRPPATTTTIKNDDLTTSTTSNMLTSTDESVSPSSIFTESLTKSSTKLSTTPAGNSNAANTWSLCFTMLAQILFMTLYFVHL